ncbi:MAG: class I SAM-dependent methyltransferase [Bacteroidales bacterium]|nr:class I SAM-dependent methyltransferase [Bacteroidales bacterium]
MKKEKTEIFNEIANYYNSKLKEHGATPCGVDWNGENSQILRFDQLTQIIKPVKNFSLNDLGCGYGGLLDFLNMKYQGVDYTYIGYDISDDMICSAKSRHANRKNARFCTERMPMEIADYSVASGVFNVRLENSEYIWKQHIKETLDILNQYSSKGFSFNCLTSYSDIDKMQSYLYYADPCALFDLCKTHYSKNVALLHDYGLYEFTILVRKQL